MKDKRSLDALDLLSEILIKGVCITILIGALTFFVLFVFSVVVEAKTLWKCDFEPNGSSACVSGKQDNEVKTFSQFGIPKLHGGGKYAITAKNKKQVSASNVNWTYKSHATNNLYARMYVYFPHGYRGLSRFANSLKFWGALSNAKDGTCGECVWSSTWWKLAEKSGKLYLAPQHLRVPTITKGRIPKAIERGKWHYLEFHLWNNANGDDLIEAWLDKDSRNYPRFPSSKIEEELYPIKTDKWGIVESNPNWSGPTAPPRVQEYYLDGLMLANTPIGDTYGLLGGKDTSPPVPPNRIKLSPK